MAAATRAPAAGPDPGRGDDPGLDDGSADFRGLRRQLLAETHGEYQRFLAGLAPRYGQAWAGIGLGYGLLVLVLAATGLPQSPAGALVAMVVGAVGVGYGVAGLQLYLHEAAHHHLAPSRRLNDWLCDGLISWQVGTSVSRYRPIHFGHHQHLGTTADPENSYFRPLDGRLVLETLTGIHALRVLDQRRRRLAGMAVKPAGHPVATWLRAGLFHGLVCAGAYGLSGWPGLGAWLLGMGGCYPVLATVRQQLEHRAADADPAVDYARTDHGALTRMFGVGPLASTFGGAGFNRHLLHHWEPQVSCTRLADLERYLEHTSVAPLLAARRSSYLATLARLWRGRTGRARG